jgi:hypothetical protein
VALRRPESAVSETLATGWSSASSLSNTGNDFCGYGGSSGTTILQSSNPTDSGGDTLSLCDAASVNFQQPAGNYAGTSPTR